MAEKESPTIEETTPEAPTEINTDGLLKELESLNITDPKQIQDIAHASQQTGRAWNEVGELRQQVTTLQQQLQASQNAPREIDTEFSSEPIDIRDMVKGAVREFYVDEIAKPQQQAAQNYWNEKRQVQTDQDYQNNPQIKKMWDAHEQNPDFLFRLQTGQTSMTKEFDRLRVTYFRELAKRSHETINSLTKTEGKTPYVEPGETRSTPSPVPIDERNEQAQKIDKQRRDGTMSSEDALLNLVDTFLPKNDPIWRRE